MIFLISSQSINISFLLQNGILLDSLKSFPMEMEVIDFTGLRSIGAQAVPTVLDVTIPYSPFCLHLAVGKNRME